MNANASVHRPASVLHTPSPDVPARPRSLSESEKGPPLITSFVKAYLQGAQSTCSVFVFSTTHWLYSLERRETWKPQDHPCVSFQETEAGGGP